MKMRYPTLADIKSSVSAEIDEIDLITKCIECVYDDDEMFEPENAGLNPWFKKELYKIAAKEFLDLMKI